MNFLAHVFLADFSPALRVGGLIGDFVKGPLPGALPPDLAAGVALHRAIDSYADRHPAFRASRQRIGPLRRRWAGVLVDIYYDHLLACRWPEWHTTPLAAFSQRVYAECMTRLDTLPATSRPVLARMQSQDWLGSYAEPAVVATTFRRMAARIARENPLAGAEEELFAALPAFAADCDAFLHDAQRFATDWLSAPATA